MYEKLVADVEYLNGNYSVAADMYHDGARDGDPVAAFNYGYCLWRGIGVSYDPKEAKSFFVYSSELEGGEACYNLAMLYMHGEGVPRDYRKCAEYMKRSAIQGCIEAQLYLGMAYTSGCIFEPDVIGISMIPFHKPEYRDSVPMLDGDVPDFEEDEDRRYSAIKQDAHLAFEWFRAAARHDPTYVEELTAKGKYLYARCYVDGLGTDFDREKSTRLMLAASRSGSAEATSYILENGLAPLLDNKANKNTLKEIGG
ncbi:MAG: sel1 repeat family protein [Clostridia bacterium]|nr:sel1 repeat family protein [Clostridia bacterium]